MPILQSFCRCEDYLLIDNGELGYIEICGNSAPNISGILPGNTTIVFRTSEKGQYTGFQMIVICFNESEEDIPGMLYSMACLSIDIVTKNHLQ